MVACVSIVATLCPPLSREVAWQKAAAMLNLSDPLRTWYRWQRAAYMLEDARNCQDEEPAERSLEVA
jgi:hypothetical protein